VLNTVLVRFVDSRCSSTRVLVLPHSVLVDLAFITLLQNPSPYLVTLVFTLIRDLKTLFFIGFLLLLPLVINILCRLFYLFYSFNILFLITYGKRKESPVDVTQRGLLCFL